MTGTLQIFQPTDFVTPIRLLNPIDATSAPRWTRELNLWPGCDDAQEDRAKASRHSPVVPVSRPGRDADGTGLSSELGGGSSNGDLVGWLEKKDPPAGCLETLTGG